MKHKKKNLEFVPTKYQFFSKTAFSQEIIDESLEIERERYEISLLGKEDKKAAKAELKQKSKALLAELTFEYKKLLVEEKALVREEIDKVNETKTITLAEIDDNFKESTSKIEEEFALKSEEERKDPLAVKDFNNSINGAKIVAKRAKLKANSDYEYDYRICKNRLFDLHHDYLLIKQVISGTFKSIGDAFDEIYYEKIVTFNAKAYFSNKNIWIQLIPFFLLVAMFIVFYIIKGVTQFKGGLMEILVNAIFVAIVATGAVFIYSGGSFDMSLGSSATMCFFVAAIVYNNTHNVFLMFISAISLGMFLGIMNAVLASILDLPVMVMTLTMMNILNALYSSLTLNMGATDKFPVDDMPFINGIEDKYIIYAGTLILFFLLCWAIFNYTKIGRRNKLCGSNRLAGRFSGINLMKLGVISFALSGIGIGLAGILFAMHNEGTGVEASANTLGSVGLNVIIAITLGGMTTSGGPKSRISCGLIGALFVSVLDQVFAALKGVNPLIENYKYIAKGVFFLFIALLNMWNSRPKKLLAR